MKLKHDPATCQNAEVCIKKAPNLIRMDQGKVIVSDASCESSDTGLLLELINGCPSNSLSIDDEGSFDFPDVGP